MSSRCDEKYAKEYEEDVRWYEDFRSDKATEYQLQTIEQIEKRRICIKFDGTTKKEASEFIKEFGNKEYNQNSNERFRRQSWLR